MASPESLKFKTQAVIIDNGIRREEIGHIVQALSSILASTYTLYIKTQNFHWNVVGPHFYSLHKLSESHYTELSSAIDEIAERIRTLGHVVTASYTWFNKMSEIEEQEEIQDAQQMIQQLINDHETLIRICRASFTIAERGDDQATCDLITRRLMDHEKAVWMLRSSLG